MMLEENKKENPVFDLSRIEKAALAGYKLRDQEVRRRIDELTVEFHEFIEDLIAAHGIKQVEESLGVKYQLNIDACKFVPVEEVKEAVKELPVGVNGQAAQASTDENNVVEMKSANRHARRAAEKMEKKRRPISKVSQIKPGPSVGEEEASIVTV